MISHYLEAIYLILFDYDKSNNMLTTFKIYENTKFIVLFSAFIVLFIAFLFIAIKTLEYMIISFFGKLVNLIMKNNVYSNRNNRIKFN